MSVYIVTYDLKKPGQDYKDLHSAIKSAGTSWWHYLESTWMVASQSSASALFEKLKPHIDSNDRLLIIKVTNEYSGWLTQEAWDWIKTHVTAKAYV